MKRRKKTNQEKIMIILSMAGGGGGIALGGWQLLFAFMAGSTNDYNTEELPVVDTFESLGFMTLIIGLTLLIFGIRVLKLRNEGLKTLSTIVLVFGLVCSIFGIVGTSAGNFNIQEHKDHIPQVFFTVVFAIILICVGIMRHQKGNFVESLPT
mgnify:CR=1 FL=1